jgi:hypothetical protein
MNNFLIAVSGVLTVAAALPYIAEIIKGKAKPRIVSWFTWSVLTGIACAASFVDGKIPSAALMLALTLETSLIVILGFKHGDRKLERLDMYCLVGAAVGLVLWLVFNSPTIAVLASILIDIVGAIPTVKHSWEKPHEETWVTFAITALGGAITVVIAGEMTATAIAYPIYIFLLYVVLTICVLASPRRKLASEPIELSE